MDYYCAVHRRIEYYERTKLGTSMRLFLPSSWPQVLGPVLAFALDLLGGGTDTLWSQGSADVRVPSVAHCDECRLSLSRLTILRSDNPQVDVSAEPDQVVVRDSRGWVFLVNPGNRTRLGLLDPEGRAVRELGRSGSGPGEFRYIQHIAVGPGDTLFAWDRGLRRMSVFSPAPVVSPVRVYTLPYQIEGGGFRVLPSGDLIANAIVGHSARFGHPLHRFSAAGELLDSWGGDSLVVLRSDPLSSVRYLCPASKGLWTIRANSYHLELWGPDLRLQQSVRRVDRKFPSYRVNRISPTEPPNPLYVGVQEQPDGLLMVLALVPDPKWRQGVRFKDGPHGPDFEFTNPSKVYDTVFEVIDPARGRLLLSERHDGVFTGFIGSGLVAELGVERGEGVTAVWRVVMNRIAQ